MTHTPGPWAVSRYCGGESGIYPEGSERGGDIALVRLGDNHAADAALIAAAPTMLGALRDAESWLANGGEVDGVFFDEASLLARVCEVIAAATDGEG